MAGVPIAIAQVLLEYEFVNTDYIAFSENGSSESANLARTAIADLGNWAAATSADPSVRANTSAGATPAASAGCTQSHWAVFSAAAAGTQKTDWTALTASFTLLTTETASIAAGAFQVRCT